MSEAGIIDFAGLDATAAAAEPEVTQEPTEVETPVEGSEPEVTQGETNEDGTPKETVEAKDKEAKEDLPGDKSTPDSIRKALKALKDSSPENAGAVKELHGAFERWNAAKQIFPKGVAEMKEAKAFIELVGGQEGYESLNETVESIRASDELLYAGDAKLLDNIIEDLKSENKLDAFGKLAPAFLDKLKSVDEKAYYSAFAPHFLQGLTSVNMPGAIAGLAKALENTDPAVGVASAKELVKSLSDWFTGLKTQAETAKKEELNPERQELEKARQDLANQQKEFETSKSKEFQNGVAKEAESVNNRTLGESLKEFLRLPFFKGFSRENLTPLANTIKTDLYDTLKADKTYQSWMKAQWGAKSPDRAKIVEYHKAKVESLAGDIVRRTVQRMYPGYAKNGVAAGRIAAVETKKAAVAKVEQKAVASGKPIYVAQKPAWDAIDWDKDPRQLLYIAGRAHLRGSGKLVTWRR